MGLVNLVFKVEGKFISNHQIIRSNKNNITKLKTNIIKKYINDVTASRTN